MRLRFSIGAITMLAGFTIYQLGFYVAFHQGGLLEQLARQILPPVDGSADLSNFLIQLAGGLLAIIGFVIFTTGFAKPQSAPTVQQPIAIQETVEPRPVVSTKKCKFCSADMPESATFCPACKKAQG